MRMFTYALQLPFCVGMLLSAVACAGENSPTPSFINNGVTAHRGFSGEHPENTLRAFEAGMRAGADWLECDIYKTTDGKLVVVHDGTTGRVAEKNLVVAESSWAQLATLDVAYRFRQARGLSLQKCPVARMPLLEEVICLVMKQNHTRLSIQAKQDIVDEAIALIRSLGAERWVGFNEGSFARVARVKELSPVIHVFYDTDGIGTKMHVEQAKSHGFESVVMYYKNITEEDVQLIHEAGLEAGAWTVNGRSDMKRLLGLGIDRIYTDYPNVLREELCSQKGQE